MLTFKSIPYQIKLNDGEYRQNLSSRFLRAVDAATLENDNLIFMRKWIDYGTRFGELNDVIEEITEEIEALYNDSIIQGLVNEAKEKKAPEPKKYFKFNKEQFLNKESWKDRLWMLYHLDTPSKEDFPLLIAALNDEKMQVRRQAVSLMAMIEDKETLNYLKHALQDQAIPVRRTAGDAYSDLGYKEGLVDIYPLLKDKSPIVRWRAAMFVYEVGDASSLPYLYESKDDSEYDVRLQKEMAITRIEKGEEALGSVWKQIQERNK